MKKYILILLMCIGTFNLFSQNNTLDGKWKFEKAIIDTEIDEESKQMLNTMFESMFLAFDSNKYQQSIMGKAENGTWIKDEDGLFFISSKGYEYEVSIEIISDTQIIFNHNKMKIQLKKIESEFKIDDFTDNIDKITGIEIDKLKLTGKWICIGVIKNDGKLFPAIKHSKEEPTNYNFKEDGVFENKAPLGLKRYAYWEISENLKMIILQSDNKNEYLKVVKLNETELEIFSPINESIIKFEKEK